MDETVNRLNRASFFKLEKDKLKLDNLQQSLKSLNPVAVLNRGYAIVTKKTNKTVIKNSEQVNISDDVHIRVSQGSLEARVIQKFEENNYDQ